MSQQETYQCFYCSTNTTSFGTIIDHTITIHPDCILKYKLKKPVSLGQVHVKTKSFKIVPNEVKQSRRAIVPNNIHKNIEIIDYKDNMDAATSPIRKRRKNEETIDKKRIREDVSDDHDINTISSMETNDLMNEANENMDMCGESYETKDEIDDSDVISDIACLIPQVVKNLREAGKLNVFIKFLNLISKNLFPLDNIAFLLFCDVVTWHSLENTSLMRYNEVVRLFWRTGLKMFKGKFLRFMSGPKNNGNIVLNITEKGKYSPSQSEINFAVPDRSILDKMVPPFSKDLSQPSIISSMIETVSSKDMTQEKTFKICVDGKKINASTKDDLGQIDLWDYEDKPTRREKQSRLDQEMETMDNCTNYIRETLNGRCCTLSDCSANFREGLYKIMLSVLHVLSYRLQDLRKLKVSKQLAHEKFLKMVEGNWRESKYAYAISSIKTVLYDVNTVTSDLIKCIDEVGFILAGCNDVSHLYSHGKTLNLQNQANYVCLVNFDESTSTTLHQSPETTKQRSDAWFKIRENAVVTGSTLNAAIGLDTLVKQQEHFKKIFQNKNTQTEVTEPMQHGLDNEINCIATFVGKVLPIYNPKVCFVEEGCYLIENSGLKAVVSPDGSCRMKAETGSLGIPISGLEIKCPFPGKIFTTPVHYSLPSIYVPQVLSEMAALNTNYLWFLSYSKESTSVIEVNFDENLWKTIKETATDLYSNKPKYPTKLHRNVSKLKGHIKTFINDNTKFVAELPSIDAIPCTHLASMNSNCRQFHEAQHVECRKLDIDNIIDNVGRWKNAIKSTYDLHKSKASEVLMFLISDLDRMANKEEEHAVPIGYALKGYSMKTDTLRKMLDDLLQECFLKGLYVPVISFDGQWNQISIRSSNDSPLTVLQLQKDVYAKTKSLSKSYILNHICNLNVVSHSNTIEDLKSKVDLGVTLDIWGSYTSSIDVGCVLNSEKPITVTSHMQSVIKNQPVGSEKEQQMKGTENEICEQNASKITIDNEEPQDQNDINEDNEEDEISIQEPEADTLLQMTREDADVMIHALNAESKNKRTFSSVEEFFDKFAEPHLLSACMNKQEIKICFKCIVSILKQNNIDYALSWPKYKMVELLSKFRIGFTKPPEEPKRKSRKLKVHSLQKLCKDLVRKYSKEALNVVYAEYVFPKELKQWQNKSVFGRSTLIHGLDLSVVWFSQPEYNLSRMCYHFYLLDCHHLLTNARIKCCKTGIPEAGIKRDAWIKVAKESDINKCNLSIALVEDLLDKQSNAFAQQTFSEEVENVMIQNGDLNEARFCRLIREWYEAEDDPGIHVGERVARRIRFRNWLLQGVTFNSFPPPGAFVKGIPIVMYEGFLNNLDRRLQLFPFVKSGVYNVRALGSLEAENIFSAFQDLDPRGSGVIRPEDLPNAISTACELVYTRMNPNRGFSMSTSKAKVYPTHSLLDHSEMPDSNNFIYPLRIDSINPRDHMFDCFQRAERVKNRKRTVTISKPSLPSKGVKPVRELFRVNETKILPHRRQGIDISG